MIFLPEESRGSRRSPADHRSESRLSIPQRGALQRSSSLLPQPSSILKRTVEIVENHSANGQCLVLRLSHFWGAPQSVYFCRFHPSPDGISTPLPLLQAFRRIGSLKTYGSASHP